ncbi:MAG: winged helix DNA-binding domain-containing protein [Candidatus Limnocylindrales bacterium]
MRLTARQLNRATLERQLLLRRASLPVVDAVHRVVALQAQAPPSPYIGLWNRVAEFEPAELDRAFAGQAVVKASLMRIAMQAVAGADYPTFHEAMQISLRPARLNDQRFRVAGLSIPEADALIPTVAGYAAEPRTIAEVEAWLDERLGPPPRRGVWWAMRHYGPFVHAATGGPWSFGDRPSYVAARVQERPGDEAASIQRLAYRYLEGFGPATARDLATFAMISRPRAMDAVRSLADSLARFEGLDGSELFDVPGGALPDEDTPAPPRLMAMWDNALLAYVDRSRIIPPDYRRHVTRSNGDVLPTLLVDGYVAGVWRPVEDGIEATAFHRLPDDAWAGLEEEARALRTFLADRELLIYRRYAHWWATLPGAEVRVLV